MLIHANTHGAFIEDVASLDKVIYAVKLICQILSNISDPEGEISLCTLSAVNWGVVKDTNELEKVMS